MDELTPSDPVAIGQFRLLGRLGTGGMGQVFLGRGCDGALAAVKVVHHAYAADQQFRARFARELATARHVRAAWSAPVVDADLSAARPWLATQYVPGPSLTGAVADQGGRGLPEPTVRLLAARLSTALSQLHAQRVVHRDLKPSNVLLAPDGPRLIDFGIARAMDATRITHTGMVVGTPAFMSPEQASGQDGGPSSDVFSLAAVLVFAATGQGPFGRTENAVAMLLRVINGEPNLDGLSEPLHRELASCLAKKAAQRPSAERLAERLAAVAPSPGQAWWPAPAAEEVPEPRPRPPAPAPSGTPAPAPPAKSSSTPVVLSLTAVGLVLLAVLGVVFWPRTAAPVGNPPRAGSDVPSSPITLAPPVTLKVTTTDDGPMNPQDMTMTRDGSRLLVTHGRHITAFGTASGARKDITYQGPLEFPGAIVAAPDASRVYSGEDKVLVAVGPDLSSQVWGPVTLPFKPDDLAVSPDGRRVVAVADKTYSQGMSVVDTTTGAVRSVPVALPPWGEPMVVISPDSRRAYLAPDPTDLTAVDADLRVIDLDTGAVHSIGFGRDTENRDYPEHLVFSPDGQRLYVQTDSRVAVIDPGTDTIVDSILLANLPNGLAVSPDGRRLAVSHLTSSGVQIYDIASKAQIAHGPLPGTFNLNINLMFSPDGRRLYALTDHDVAEVDTSVLP